MKTKGFVKGKHKSGVNNILRKVGTVQKRNVKKK